MPLTISSFYWNLVPTWAGMITCTTQLTMGLSIYGLLGKKTITPLRKIGTYMWEITAIKTWKLLKGWVSRGTTPLARGTTHLVTLVKRLKRFKIT